MNNNVNVINNLLSHLALRNQFRGNLEMKVLEATVPDLAKDFSYIYLNYSYFHKLTSKIH